LRNLGQFTGEALSKIAEMAAKLGNFFIAATPPTPRPEPLLRGARRELGRVEYETPKLLAPTANIEMKTAISNIEIKLPEDSLDKMAEKVGKDVEEKLKTDESLQKFIANVIRPYL